MKKEMLMLLLVFLMSSLVFASVKVHDFSLKDSYLPSEVVSGKINLTILNENFYSDIHSSDGQKIQLGQFLKRNDAKYSCHNIDCSSVYKYSQGSNENTYKISPGNTTYAGFVIKGANVKITGVEFKISSDFKSGDATPLTIRFFDSLDWRFKEHLKNSFSNQYFGCFDKSKAFAGPLIRKSSYCERIEIPETPSIKVGALVKTDDSKDLKMVVYSGDVGIEKGSCEFNPTTEDGCVIEADFSRGNYSVCVSPTSSSNPTNYKIYEENSGQTCGFVKNYGYKNSSKDYGVFVRISKFAGSDAFNSSLFDFKKISSSADNFVDEKYGRDCSKGCVLPIALSGVSQNLKISQIVLDYTDEVDKVATGIYKLEALPVLVNFSGVLDLGMTKFNISKSGKYAIYLDNKKLLEEKVTLLSSPEIVSVYPLNLPAGIPVVFHASVLGGVSRYKWDFGDGQSVETSESFVSHTYKEVKSYTLSLEIKSSNNLSSKKSFAVNAVSPKDAVETYLKEKGDSLNKTYQDLESFKGWYGGDLIKIADIEGYLVKLKKLEKEKESASTNNDFIGLAQKLLNLSVPVGAFSEKISNIQLASEDIDPAPIMKAEGMDISNKDLYSDFILEWQKTNVNPRISKEKIFLLFNGDRKAEILDVYSLDLSFFSNDKAYLVVQGSKDNLHFRGDVAEPYGDYLVVPLNSKKETVEFYQQDPGEPLFFVSPSLKDVVLEGLISKDCNYNGVCESGENYKTCRSDCKPTFWIILYSILALLFVIIIYTILQVWYKRNYEGHLFEDRKQLYNLLMFISNARARGISDSEIAKSLKKQGWSGERVAYAIRKSNGKTTGLPEIIPVEKISAYFRNRSAKKMIATLPKQHFRRNINKSRFPGQFR